jgi:hypothetical protein
MNTTDQSSHADSLVDARIESVAAAADELDMSEPTPRMDAKLGDRLSDG